MPEHGEQLSASIERYERFRVIPMDGIFAHLEELNETFQAVQACYGSQEEQDQREIAEEDKQRLWDCIEDLSPMARNDAVQKEVDEFDGTEGAEELAFNRIEMLHMEIITFMAGFNNTGVAIFESRDDKLD